MARSTLTIIDSFYSYLPISPPSHLTSRTFVVLPDASSPYISRFLQAPNGVAGDEIEAHTGMFDAKTNDGYYELGLLTAQLLRDVMVTQRTQSESARKSTMADGPRLTGSPISHSMTSEEAAAAPA